MTAAAPCVGAVNVARVLTVSGLQITQYMRKMSTDKMILGFVALIVLGIIAIIVLHAIGVVGDDDVNVPDIGIDDISVRRNY